MTVELVCLIVTALALAWAGNSYRVLRLWIRDARGLRIAIAYKRRVVSDAPLTDWLAWGRLLGDDESSTGRVIYRGGHVSVALLKPRPPVLEVSKSGPLRRLVGAAARAGRPSSRDAGEPAERAA